MVLIALIITYVFVPKKNENNFNVPQSSIVIKSFKAEEIREISIKNFSGEITIVNAANNWRMAAPADYKLDSVSVAGFVKNVCNFKASDIINNQPSDLNIYGLKAPAAELTVKLKDGKAAQFKLGSKLPTGSGYYLMASDSAAVYSVNDFTAGDILRTAGEFRDKTIFNFNKKSVAFLSVSKQGKTLFQFKRNNIGWDVVTAAAKAGDNKKIENIIDKLSTLKVKEFINPLSYTKETVIGRNNSYTITIGVDKQPALKLIVGQDKDEESIYAEKEGSTEVFTVYKGDVNFVRNKLEEFIKK